MKKPKLRSKREILGAIVWLMEAGDRAHSKWIAAARRQKTAPQGNGHGKELERRINAGFGRWAEMGQQRVALEWAVGIRKRLPVNWRR